MKLPTIPPGLAGKIVQKRPALGTNQIAGFKGFRPLANLEKNKIIYHFGYGIYYIHTYLLLAEFSVRIVNYGPSFFGNRTLCRCLEVVSIFLPFVPVKKRCKGQRSCSR